MSYFQNITDSAEVGNRVRGRYSERLGIITRVATEAVFVTWDGEAVEDPTPYHRVLHLLPDESAPVEEKKT